MDHILTLSWGIATHPQLYRELILNPYTSHSLQLISEKFPDENATDVIKAIVLAEPEGRYDLNFGRLSKEDQKKELSKQNKQTREINKRLIKYCRKHSKDLKILSNDFIYETLSLVVFESVDKSEIEESFSQDQRRDFRLKIVGFIENPKRESFYDKPLLKFVFAATSLAIALFVINVIPHPEVKKQVLAVETQNTDQVSPVRLTIPSIKVDAAVEKVGITSVGIMDVPKDTADVGWFNLGPRPGEVGSAVIAGHLDDKNGKAAVFANLNKLKVGDKLYIENGDGSMTTFVVRGTRIYTPGYADDVFSRNDGAHLNLVTCDGVWDGALKSYSKRLVVFTDKE